MDESNYFDVKHERDKYKAEAHLLTVERDTLHDELDRMRRERDDAINAKKVIIDERIESLQELCEGYINRLKVANGLLEQQDEALEKVQEERDALRRAFDDIIVWAARYAHGRATYAPTTVRRAVEVRKRFDPDWKPTGRVGLTPLSPDITLAFLGDDLTDLFSPEDS